MGIVMFILVNVITSFAFVAVEMSVQNVHVYEQFVKENIIVLDSNNSFSLWLTVMLL